MKQYTCDEVASMLGITVATLREGAKQDKFEFVKAFIPEGSTRYTYVVLPNKVKEYICE